MTKENMNNEFSPSKKLTKQFTCAIQVLYNLVQEQHLITTSSHPIFSQLCCVFLLIKKHNTMFFLKQRWKKLNIFNIRLGEVISLPTLNLSLSCHKISLYNY